MQGYAGQAIAEAHPSNRLRNARSTCRQGAQDLPQYAVPHDPHRTVIMKVHIGGIFQSDADRCFKAGLPKDVLRQILKRLSEDLTFSSSFLSRRFSGPLAGCMELRFGDGWSLVYTSDGDSITLVRIGTEDEICQK